eukprot:9306699-Ditylum_brightwellii.AAC.1
MAHLYFEQGYIAIKHLVSHLCKAIVTGAQIMVALSQAQLISKSSSPYLEGVKVNRSYVPAS